MSNYNFEQKDPTILDTLTLHDSVVLHGEHVTDFNSNLDPDKYYLFGSVSSDEYKPIIVGPFDASEIINESWEEE